MLDIARPGPYTGGPEMKLLRYSNLDTRGLTAPFDRTAALLEKGDFRGADVKKLAPTPFYRAKLSDSDRLIFRFATYRNETYLVLLEVVRNHAYDTSRFLRGAAIDEGKLEPLTAAAPAQPTDAAPLNYVNPSAPRVHILDKILSFDELQESALLQRPPLILIGSAGSGKTVLTLEKLRQLPGDILYVTHSPFLVDNARSLYYANHYENDAQDVAFFSFIEFVQSIAVPPGRPISFTDFAAWFARNRGSCPIKDAHPLFEEFNGVLTGSAVTRPYLSLDEYLALGIRRSIFTGEDRPAVYALFRRYLESLKTGDRYDLNLVCFEHHARCRPMYDFVVADEVQDLTAVQLSLVLKSLRIPEQFVLCGDSNQIVHPNFFSWATVKSFFYQQRLNGQQEIVRVLNTNYRNSPQVTDLANRLLLIKNARFGSIDRESHYLVRPISENAGTVEFHQDTDAVRRDIDSKTGRSTRFAVLVMREEDKEEARRSFRTPLVFSIREAKGLEYENIILLNFVSANARPFAEIVAGVTADDLAADFTYARAKDKGDKSLEAYKFFINALYVAVTRAVRNVYLLERAASHPLLDLLRLRPRTEPVQIAAQQSTVEEWKAEALKLERQGKTEQVEAIRRSILRTEPVPWMVLTPAAVETLAKEALDGPDLRQKARRQLLEYAATYSVTPLIARLQAKGFEPAQRPDLARHEAMQRSMADYRQRGYRELFHKMERHGVDFRNPLNQTPLMVAAQAGLGALVRQLVQQGANIHLRDPWNRIPLQIALRAAYHNEQYARDSLGDIYDALAPDSIKVRVGNRLVKIDNHRMEFFLLHSMLALFESIVRRKIRHGMPAFETADFVHALAHFPEAVIPSRRRNRQSITAALAGNEVFRDDRYNRRLFARLRRGYYIPNPCMDIEMGDAWTPVADLLHLDSLEREQEDRCLSLLITGIRACQKDVGRLLDSLHAADPGTTPFRGPSIAASDLAAAARAPTEPAQPAPADGPAATDTQPPPGPLELSASFHAPAAAPSAAVPPPDQPPAPMPASPVAPAPAAASAEVRSAPTQPTPHLRSELTGKAAEIEKGIFSEDGRAPLASLRWILDNPDAGAAILLGILEDAVTAKTDQPYRSPTGYLVAMLMLAQLKDKRAFPLVIRFASRPDVEDILDDFVTEDLGRVLASVFDGDIEPLQRLIENPAANEWARSACLSALELLVLFGKAERESVIGYLRRLMDIHGGRLEREFSQVWNALADSALNLHPGDLLADLDRAYGEGLVDPGYVSLREIVRQARHPVAEVLQRSRKASMGLVTDAIVEIKRWPAFAAPERPVSPPKPDRLLANASRQPRPVAVPSRPGSANHFGAPPLSDAALTSFFAPGVPIHAEPKTGRNDPCPCGSGRKYKRCCEGKS
jgi:hypothetical protein